MSKIYILKRNLYDKPDWFKMWIYESGHWKNISFASLFFSPRLRTLLIYTFQIFVGYQ